MEGKVACELDCNENNTKINGTKNMNKNNNDLKAILDREAQMNINDLVETLRQKILTLSTLPYKPRTDTPFLLKFLRTKKYDVDIAVEGIVKYYNHIQRNMRILEGIKPSEYPEPFDSHTIVPLKHRWNGSTILYCAMKNWNTKQFCLRDMQCAGLFLLEEVLKDNENQANGLIGIFDISGLGFCHLRQLTAFEIKNCIHMILNGLPTRIAGLHVVNAPTLFWPIFKVVNKLLPEKIRERVTIHSDLESLHKEIDSEILPVSLGGHLEESEAFDEHLITSLIKSNPNFESYWSADTSVRPRRLNRKRSSLMIN